jgi:hypothetical protein
VNETMLMTLEFEGDLYVNEVTWFELTHQYLVTLVEVKKSGVLTGLRLEERMRLIGCLPGDGGVLFGATGRCYWKWCSSMKCIQWCVVVWLSWNKLSEEISFVSMVLFILVTSWMLNQEGRRVSGQMR